MEIVNIHCLDEDQIEFIYEIRKKIEMMCALTNEIFGIERGKTTTAEVKALLISLCH